MHKAGRTAEGEELLIQPRQRHVHGEEAELFVLDLLNPDTPQSETAVQAIAEDVVGNRRGQSQGCLLDKKDPLTQIHRVEERGRSAAPLRLTEVITAVIHQDELPWLNGRFGEAADDSIGRLTGDWPLVGPLNKGRVMSTGINNQTGLQDLPGIGGHKRVAELVLNR
jgi:hypothetical protein